MKFFRLVEVNKVPPLSCSEIAFCQVNQRVNTIMMMDVHEPAHDLKSPFSSEWFNPIASVYMSNQKMLSFVQFVTVFLQAYA